MITLKPTNPPVPTEAPSFAMDYLLNQLLTRPGQWFEVAGSTGSDVADAIRSTKTWEELPHRDGSSIDVEGNKIRYSNMDIRLFEKTERAR